MKHCPETVLFLGPPTGEPRQTANCPPGARLLAFARRGLPVGRYGAERIRFGTFLAPFHSVRENPTLALERDLALVEHLDRLGFDEVWVGEHHSGGMEIVASPEIFIAAAAERTRRIGLGTGVVTLPYHHPFLVAERINQLDHQTRGRVMFGVGAGALPYDADMMGIDVARIRDMMTEALDVIVPLLDGETVSRRTGWFELREARLQLAPFTRPRVELAVPSVVSPSGPARRRQVRHEPAVYRRHHARRVRGSARDLADLRRGGEGARPGGRSRALAAGRARPRRRDPRAGPRQCPLRPPGVAALLRPCRPPAARCDRRGGRGLRHRYADRLADRGDRHAGRSRRPDRAAGAPVGRVRRLPRHGA